MTDPADRPVVLVVDDEQNLADLFAAWLSEEYAVRTAYGGHAALEAMDDSVDIVLLDRRMPEMSGDEVLGRLRDAGYDCLVAMVTAAEPDFDIIELGFDDYLVKPVTREELLETTAWLLELDTYGERLQEYFTIVSTMTSLQAEKSEHELQTDPQYSELVARFEEIKDDARAQLVDLMDSGTFDRAFERLSMAWDDDPE